MTFTCGDAWILNSWHLGLKCCSLWELDVCHQRNKLHFHSRTAFYFSNTVVWSLLGACTLRSLLCFGCSTLFATKIYLLASNVNAYYVHHTFYWKIFGKNRRPNKGSFTTFELVCSSIQLQAVQNNLLSNHDLTRMHSSRMRTVRCSGHLVGGASVCPGGCLPGGGVCPDGVCPEGCVHLPPPVEKILDT